MAYATRSPDESFPPVLPIGNEFVSLPHVNPSSGAIPDLYVISDRAMGLVGLRGGSAPLLRPVVRGQGALHPFAAEEVEREDAWTLLLRGRAGAGGLALRILTPPEERGFVILLETEASVELGLELCWEEATLAIFRSRALPTQLRIRWDEWTASLCGEALGPLPLIGWAVAGEDPSMTCELQPTREGEWRAILLQRPAEGRRCAFFVAVSAEEDGARTTAVHLRRCGGEALWDRTRRWLRARRVPLTDAAMEERANLNLLFNRFFATGLTLDGERPCAVTSRSPRYYVSGGFWARDALLWSLPGLAVQDPAWAGRVLREILRTTWPQGADHALYLTGTHLYPGFELDQLCAYPIALETARGLAPGTGGDDPLVQRVMRDFPALLSSHFDEEMGLYRTFLDPSDDPPPHPFLTYVNVLAWRALEICAAWQERDAAEGRGAAADPGVRRMAGALRSAIRRQCVSDGPFGPMYTWASDGRGGRTFYDNPPGSLLLLPYHGFCQASDATWQNTVRWIFSGDNPFLARGPFGGPCSSHAPHPWPMVACNQILCGQIEAGVDFLRRAAMDDGIACETVDELTGRVRTGGAFAALAGYLGFALWRALGAQGPSQARRGTPARREGGEDGKSAATPRP